MKKWFENLKISRKLIIGFLVVVILSAAVGVVGIITILDIRNNDTRLYEEDTQLLQYAGDAGIEFMQIRYNSLQRVYTTDQASLKEIVAEINDNFNHMDELLAKCQETVQNEELKALLDQIQGDWDTYRPAMAALNEDALKGKTQAVDPSLVALGTSLCDDFITLFEKVSEEAAVTSADNAAEARNSIIIMLAVILIAFILSLSLGLYISGIISKPMRKFAALAELLATGGIQMDKVIDDKDKLLKYRKDEVGALAAAFHKIIDSTVTQAQEVQTIAGGDLTVAVTVRSADDVLGQALSELVDKFHRLAASIVASSDQVNSGAKLVADSSTALSQGAAEQASAVEELTASLEEITSQTTQNAQSAQTADELTRKIKHDAEAGNNQMAEMLRAMDEINSSSDNIGKIIKVIEDITFQTNILALNAAVEAARAGQYGKGFAVVAEEVRNLAGQSSKAAQETTDLIGHSVKKVEVGTKLANDTAKAFGKIVTDVSQATDLVDSIAKASNEQAAALEQINQGIIQVSQVVQSNAASSEECAAASEELSSQADGLKESVSVFKLNTGGDSRPVQPRSKDAARVSEAEPVAVADTKAAKIDLADRDFGKY